MSAHSSSSAPVNHPEIDPQTAALDYVRRGWALTWIDSGKKYPEHPGWNTPACVVTDPATVRQRWNGTPRNIGLVHGLGAVKTCSLDVDQVAHTRAALGEFGIDLDALRLGVPCVVGNPANFRLLYQQPPGLNLPLVKLEWPDPNNPKNKIVIFELRAGANQDVLPPSLHPNGNPYRWAQPLPENPADHPQPPAALLELWQNWESWEPALKEACPWAKPAEPKATPHRKADGARPDVIGAFNTAHDLRELLEAHGYQPRGARRYLPPNSTSGVPSVRILDSGKVFSSNGSCPLNDGHAHDAFSVFCILEHGGRGNDAVRAAARMLGIEFSGDAYPRGDALEDGKRIAEVLIKNMKAEAKSAPVVGGAVAPEMDEGYWKSLLGDAAAISPANMNQRKINAVDPTRPPPFEPFTEAELTAARLTPKCIVENYLYSDLALVAAAGGTGKTTLLIYEAVCIALGMDLWGNRVTTPGATLFVTAEDPRDLFAARLNAIMNAMNLSAAAREQARRRIMVWDVTGSLLRLAELDQHSNIQLTGLADSIVDVYRDAGLVQVIFDPAISFGPGERVINDGEQALVVACRRIVKGLNCCVRLNHHTGKANARNGALDQYASRGGTALPDGCRMVTVLSAVGNESANSAAIPPAGFELAPGESGFMLARPKLSYAPPQPTLWIRRRGWAFDYFVEDRRTPDEIRDADAEKVAEFLVDESHHGRKYTHNTLEQTIKLPRARVRVACTRLETVGRLEERDLPPQERRGRRKTYLHIAHFAAPIGEIAAEKEPPAPTDSPIPPPSINSPPYREWRNGEIDAVLSFPASLNSPKLDGEITAEWRNRGNGMEPVPANASQHPAPFPPVDAKPGIGLSADADALAMVLKLYRGWATLEELAKKAGLGSQSRVMVAAQELTGKGLAQMERGMVKPALMEVRS